MARVNPYNAVIYHNVCHMIEKTDDIKRNIQYVVNKLKGIGGTPDFPGMLGGPELPLKLVVLPESFATGFVSDFLNLDHLEAYNDYYNTTIPGPETDMLAEAAVYTGAYIMGIMQAKDPELMEDRWFNTGFIINPEGKVIYKKHKTSFFFRERATAPTDIWDRYIEKYGDDPKALMDAIYPVAKTDIGNLAVTICGEAEKPEVFRALAMNGAEVVSRCTYLPGNYEQFELQNRAHAYFNNMYVIAANGPIVYPPGETTPLLMETIGHIVDYRGRVVTRTQYPAPAETMTYATINVEELRYARFHSLAYFWVPQLRIEEYILPYQHALNVGGLYPKNLAMDEPPMGQRPHDDLLRWCINRAAELGIWTPPDGWEPYKIPQEILDKIENAKARSAPMSNIQKP